MCIVVLMALNLPGGIIEIEKDMLRVNQGDNSVKVDGAPQTVVNPE